MAQQRPKHSTEPVRLLTASPSSHRSGAGCLVTELTQAALKIEARNRFLASRQSSCSPPPRSCISLTRRPAYGPTKSQHRRLLLLFGDSGAAPSTQSAASFSSARNLRDGPGGGDQRRVRRSRTCQNRP